MSVRISFASSDSLLSGVQYQEQPTKSSLVKSGLTPKTIFENNISSRFGCFLCVFEVWNLKDFQDKLNMSRRCKFMKLNKIQIKCFYAFQFPERPAALCFVVAGAHRATGQMGFLFLKVCFISFSWAAAYRDTTGCRSGGSSD